MGLGKIELHLHLDGSMDLETSYKLAKDRHIIDEDMDFEIFSSKMMVPNDNPSLERASFFESRGSKFKGLNPL